MFAGCIMDCGLTQVGGPHLEECVQEFLVKSQATPMTHHLEPSSVSNVILDWESEGSSWRCHIGQLIW